MGAIAGSAGTWLVGLLKTWFEHFLGERKERAAEDRTIRTEQREDARKEKERIQAEAAQLKYDGDTLLMLKTQLRGATQTEDASGVVGLIHHFFVNNSHYLNIQSNRAFLEKYARDFQDQVSEGKIILTPAELAILKRDAESLRVQ